MKRSKTDHIRTTISRHMKRRQFHENEMPSKKDSKKVQGLDTLLVGRRTRQMASLENTLSLSSISGDTTACNQQYTRLKSFVGHGVKPYKDELQSLLFPMFVHIYLEVLSNGHRVPAHKFLERHASICQSEEQIRILHILRKMESKTDVLACKEIKSMRENKFVLGMSQGALDYLMRHLRTKSNMIILQVFNQHIQVDVKSTDNVGEVNSRAKVPPELRGKKMATDTKNAASSISEASGAIKTEEGKSAMEVDKAVKEPGLMERLQAAIKRLEAEPPSLPSICFYTFLNTYQGLTSATISPDLSRMSGTFEDSSISVWNLQPNLFSPLPPDVDVSRVTVAADFIHSTEDEMKSNLSIRPDASAEVATLKGHRSNVFKAQFLTHTNQYVLSCSADHTVRLWDLNRQSNVNIYQGHNWPVWDCCISPSDAWFASCSHDMTAKLWSFERGYPLRSFDGHTFDVDCVEFHPNNNFLATGSGDKTVRFWSINDARTVRLFQYHRGSVLAVAFSPDGKLLASAGEDRRVRVWDLGTGNVLKELRGHSDLVYALSFDVSSSVLASGGADCCIRLWDVKKSHSTPPREGEASPDLIGAFPTKSCLITSLKFTPFNVLLATGTSPS